MPPRAKTEAEFRNRFWSRVDRSGECWEWSGARTAFGHGQVGRDRKVLYAHRISYEIHNSPIPSDMCVMHTCDNPPCVNPAHLILGSKAENLHDMWNKGRQRGRDKVARLNEDQVRSIRRLYGEGATQAQLAEQFHVAQMTISKVVTRTTWKDVD